MRRSLYSRRRRGSGVLPVLGWFLLVGLGVWLTWYGFARTGERAQPEGTSSVAATGASPQATVQPTATLPPPPTATNTPTATPEPTPLPPTSPPPTPYIVAGADGVNVREGPATSYTQLGYLDPGAQASLVAPDGDWWQIRYADAPGWVFGDLVTTYNYNPDQAEPPPPTPTPQPEVPAAPESWPAEVFELINSVRAEQGLSPYTYNETLERAAQLHGEDCFQRGECSHIGSDGSNVQTRIVRTGYDAAGSGQMGACLACF